MNDSSRDFRIREDSLAPSANVYPARYRVRFLRRAKRMKDASILQLITGSFVILFGWVAIFMGCYLAYICTAIWCGIVIVTSAIFGIRAGRLKTIKAVRQAMMSANLVTFFSLLPVIHTSFAMSTEDLECWIFYCNCWDECHIAVDGRMFVDAMILSFSLCAFILAVLVTALCGTFSNLKCCKTASVQESRRMCQEEPSEKDYWVRLSRNVNSIHILTGHEGNSIRLSPEGL